MPSFSCAYFLSDLHLVGGDTGARTAANRDTKTDDRDRNAEIFLRFLQRLQSELKDEKAERPTHLFLVGDIFDLWIADHRYFQERFHDVVGALRDLVTKGLEIHFFEGNHDLHLKKFWQDEIGLTVHENHEYFTLGPLTIRVEHGDLMNPEDRGYLFLRWLLRTKPVKMLAFRLPSFLVQIIGERASRASRVYTSTAKELPKDKIRALIRRHAEAAFLERPFDLLISGHVHVADEYKFRAQNGRSVCSVNLGSWYEQARAYKLCGEKGEFIFLQ